MKYILILFAVFFLSGCASGKLDYIKPSNQSTNTNTKLIDHSRDLVWNSAVPELGKNFFIINNLDKSSGLINISYSGDPEQYVDCGTITSYVKNARGERSYKFAGSSAQQTYEVLEGIRLFSVQRKMNLEGRINVIFQEITPDKTQVTVNTKYVLTKQGTAIISGDGPRVDFSDTISFGTGSGGSFPIINSQGQSTECIPTGKLEQSILSLIK